MIGFENPSFVRSGFIKIGVLFLLPTKEGQASRLSKWGGHNQYTSRAKVRIFVINRQNE